MVLLTESKIQHMHTGVKQSNSLGMGFRWESGLLISSPDMSDRTLYGCKVAMELAEEAGA